MSTMSNQTKNYCNHHECTNLLIKSILFRYECPGCHKHYCERHLDWRQGHVCPGLDMLVLRNKHRLAARLPTIKNKTIEPIG